MQPFTILTAIAAPLPRANVDTDVIYPAAGGSPVARAHGGGSIRDPALMAKNAFSALRWNDDLSPKPDFVLNRTPYDRAAILIARENFGCGSSRETAVWSLNAIGFRAIIAPSFGDIFYDNCFKSGVLPIRLPRDVVEQYLTLAAESADPIFTIDLTARTVEAPDGTTRPFAIGDYHRELLLGGLDEIGFSLKRLPAIEAHERAYQAARPWLI